MPLDVKTIKIDRSVFQYTIEKKLADLPPLPAIVSKIMETINNPNTTADDLNNLIRMDQGLSSKVLRIVNSAYYGLPRRVSTVTQAVMILGFNTVRNLVLGVSSFGALSHKSIPYGLNREQFWQHSVAVAVSATALSKRRLARSRNAAEEGFIGGLLHDIGALFLDCYFPVQYAVSMAFAEKEKKSSLEAELLVLGIDHAYVGRKIAEHWNFPGHLVAMIGEHHVMPERSEHQELVSIIHAADWMAWQMHYTATPHAQPPELDESVREWLNFPEETWEWLLEEGRNQYQAAASLIQIIRESGARS